MDVHDMVIRVQFVCLTRIFMGQKQTQMRKVQTYTELKQQLQLFVRLGNESKERIWRRKKNSQTKKVTWKKFPNFNYTNSESKYKMKLEYLIEAVYFLCLKAASNKKINKYLHCDYNNKNERKEEKKRRLEIIQHLTLNKMRKNGKVKLY